MDDPEDDNMHIYIYWREDPGDEWNLEEEYIGEDGYYTAYKDFWYPSYEPDPIPGDKTLYWLVETWDDINTGLNYYDTTIGLIPS